MKNFKVGNDENVVNVHLKMSLRGELKSTIPSQGRSRVF